MEVAKLKEAQPQQRKEVISFMEIRRLVDSVVGTNNNCMYYYWNIW